MAFNLNLDRCLCSDSSDCSDCRLWLLVGSDRQTDRQCQLLSCPGQLKRLMALALYSPPLRLDWNVYVANFLPLNYSLIFWTIAWNSARALAAFASAINSWHGLLQGLQRLWIYESALLVAFLFAAWAWLQCMQRWTGVVHISAHVAIPRASQEVILWKHASIAGQSTFAHTSVTVFGSQWGRDAAWARYRPSGIILFVKMSDNDSHLSHTSSLLSLSYWSCTGQD